MDVFKYCPQMSFSVPIWKDDDHRLTSCTVRGCIGATWTHSCNTARKFLPCRGGDVCKGAANWKKNKYNCLWLSIVYIYDCKKNDKPVDFYNFQVKLKTRMVIEEYRSELYNRK